MALRPQIIAAPALALALALAACGGDDGTTAAPTTTSAAADQSTTTAGDGTTTTVDANTASVAEITAALTANGVDNAARWAREVEEYRPYPTDDPTFAKLRDELSKYNPSAETVDQIVASLSL